jgi:hypothetical protein
VASYPLNDKIVLEYEKNMNKRGLAENYLALKAKGAVRQYEGKRGRSGP